MSETGAYLDYHLDGVTAEANRALLNCGNALYAFVQGTEVRYSGTTSRTVRKQLGAIGPRIADLAQTEAATKG